MDQREGCLVAPTFSLDEPGPPQPVGGTINHLGEGNYDFKPGQLELISTDTVCSRLRERKPNRKKLALQIGLSMRTETDHDA